LSRRNLYPTRGIIGGQFSTDAGRKSRGKVADKELWCGGVSIHGRIHAGHAGAGNVDVETLEIGELL
jgi:hypothetical protein